MKKLIAIALAVALAATLSGVALAAIVHVTKFEDLSDGQLVGNHYAGLAFSAEWRAADHSTGGYDTAGFPPHSGDVAVWTGTASPAGTVTFDYLLSHVGAWVNAGTTTVYLEAYDSSDTLLTSTTVGPNEGTSTYGSVSDVSGRIKYIKVHADSNWAMDDLTYDEVMPRVDTSLSGPSEVEVGQLPPPSWVLTVEVCPDDAVDVEDVIVQGGIGADLVVTHVNGAPVTYPMDGKTSQTVGDVTLTKKGGNVGATIVTWNVGSLATTDSCESITVTFQTGLNPKDKQEFTSPEEHHELDGGFSATFWLNGIEFETPETEPQTVNVVEPE